MKVITSQFYTGTIGAKGAYNYCNIGGINIHKIYSSTYELKKAIEEQREDHNIVLADEFVVDDDDLTNSFKILSYLDEPEENLVSEFKDCNHLEILPSYSLYNLRTQKLTSPPGTMTWFCKTKKTAHMWKIKCNKDDLLVVRLDNVTKLIDAPNHYTLENIVNTKYAFMIDTLAINLDKYYDLEKFDIVTVVKNHICSYFLPYQIDQIRRNSKKIIKDGIAEEVIHTRDSYSGESQEVTTCFMNIMVEGNKLKFVKSLK